MTAYTVMGVVTATSLGTAAFVLMAALVATRVTTIVLRLAIRRVATKRLAGEPTRWRWRTRLARPLETDDALSELRRQHRIDALSLALSRVATVVIWSTAAVTLLHVFGISVSVAVGSAGFIGLILALGAQTSVNDYVTGLHVLLEDRFGEGDEIEVVTASGRNLRGVVTAHGMFATRINAEGTNHHIANRFMCEVTNHSQLGVITTLDVDHRVDGAVLAAATFQASASRPEMPTVVIDGVEELPDTADSGRERSRIHLRASRTLGDTDQHHLGQQLRRLLDTNTTPPPPGGPTPPADR